MSLLSLVVSPGNPVTTDIVTQDLAKLGLSLKPSELAEYTAVCATAHEAFKRVMALPDYVPVVNLDRFPRKDVHYPEGQQSKGWAWKVNIKDTTAASSNGLLSGKTLVLKDNIAVQGVQCLLGTDIFTDWIPNTDATVVTRILEAGAEVVGKAVCENLCLWGVSSSAATGPIDNPYAEGYSAGGSSSGCAVLIARGEVDLAIGGDQGGSIRMPASHTGTVGLKPTSGLVPYTGIASLETTIDYTGPMTKNVLDNALLLKVLAGVDGLDDRQQAGTPFPESVPDYPSLAATGVQGLRVGILRESLTAPTADPRLSALVVKAVQELTKQGAIVEEVSVPTHLLAPEIWLVVERINGTTATRGLAGGRRLHYMNDLTEKMAPLSQDKFEKMFPSMVNTIVNGQYAMEHFPASLLGKAMNQVRRIKDEYDAALASFDVLITPTIPWVPKRLPQKLGAMTPLEQLTSSAGLNSHTSPFNLSGHPALSLPIGFLSPLDEPAVRIPVGMQIVGKWYDEATVYRVAYAWESANDWKTFA